MNKTVSILAATILVVTVSPTAGAQEIPQNLQFDNCSEAHSQGQSNIPLGAPGYSGDLDRDKDGIACEASLSLPGDAVAPAEGQVVQASTPAPAPAPQCGPQAADHLLISEYHFQNTSNRDTWNPSYVELYNPTSETVDVSHYTLRSSEGGTLWNSVDLQGSMKPCSYYLIGLADYDKIRGYKRTTVEIPDADLLTDLSVGSYGALLLNKDIPAKTPYNPQNGPAPVDMLGISDLRYFEGEQVNFFRDENFEIVERHNQSLTRTDSTVDTDNNAKDFSAQPLTPTNQLSVAGGETKKAENIEKTDATLAPVPAAPDTANAQIPSPALEPAGENAQSPAPAPAPEESNPAPSPEAAPATSPQDTTPQEAVSPSTKVADPEVEAVAAAALAMSKGGTNTGTNLNKTAQRVVIVSVPSGPLELEEGMPSTI